MWHGLPVHENTAKDGRATKLALSLRDKFSHPAKSPKTAGFAIIYLFQRTYVKIGFVLHFFLFSVSCILCSAVRIGFVFLSSVVSDEAGFLVIFLFQRAYVKLPNLKLGLFCIFSYYGPFDSAQDKLRITKTGQPQV